MIDNPVFYIKISLAVLVITAAGFYFSHQARSYLTGPQIIIDSPKNGGSVNYSLLKIKGRINNVSILLIDGRQVLADSLGNFETELLLARGYNIINLSAQDKFERKVNKKLEMVLK